MGFGGDQHQFCRHVHQRIRRRSGDWVLSVNNWRIASDTDRRADNRSAKSPPPDTKLDYLAAHVRVVDRLYEELMRWTPPACASTSTDGSKTGGC